MRVNTYAAPDSLAESSFWSPPTPAALLFSPKAPTASVLPSPLSARSMPNWSLSPAFEALT
nr:hypothetical protein [Nannocystis sp.]